MGDKTQGKIHDLERPEGWVPGGNALGVLLRFDACLELPGN